MIIISIIGLIILNLFIFILRKYKIKERKNIQKKMYRFRFFDGLSMFIVDHIPRKIYEKNLKVNQAFRKLIVKQDIKNDVILYNVQKVSLCILVIEIAFILTLIVSISEKMERKNIDTIIRSASEDSQYSLEIQDKEGQKEQITIYVARKQYTKQQIENIFQKRKE